MTGLAIEGRWVDVHDPDVLQAYKSQPMFTPPLCNELLTPALTPEPLPSPAELAAELPRREQID